MHALNLRKMTALALAIGAGFVAAGTAQASVQATAVLEVLNFQIQSTGGTQLSIGAFTLPNGLASIVDNGQNNATLSGFGTVSNPGAVFGGAPMDILQACVGGPCPGQNSFAHTVPPPGAGTQLARADSKLDGAPVADLIAPGPSTGANARTVAEGLITGPAIGQGRSDLGLNTTFTFTLAQAKALRFDFDADLYLRSFISADQPFGLAQARSELIFTITNAAGTELFRWAPNGTVDSISGGTEVADGTALNDQISSLTGGEDKIRDVAGLQHFTADTNLLPANQTLVFAITHSTKADVTQFVPEPTSVLLAGLGLVGLGLSRRAKKPTA